MAYKKSDPVDGEKIAPGIFQLKMPIPNNPLENLNCYLVEGKDGWLMIDTGWYTTETMDSLKNGLGELGIAIPDIAKIVITHIHPDHFGLAGRIKQLASEIVLITHRFESDLIESRYIKLSALRDEIEDMLKRHGVPFSKLSELKSSSMPALEYVRITFPDITLYGGEIISTGIYDLEVIWTPGHSIGHICIYEPENKLLFSGDHILPKITPSIAYHTQSGDDPLGDYLNSLHKIENLPAMKILPAHENIFSDLKVRIREIRDHHEKRNNEIREAISAGHVNAYDISSCITWNVKDSNWDNLPPLSKRLAVMETLAHLEYMRWRGEVEKISKKGRIFFRLS